MKRLIIVSFFILKAMTFIAQSADSVAYSRNFVLNEGLYITYSDLRHNWPISKNKIDTKIDKNQLEFYTQLIENEDITYTERDGSIAKINSAQVWGFCQNNIVYINYNKTFFRVPVFGAISYFIATVDVANYSPGYNMFINSSGGNSSKEIHEFLMDFYTGKLFEFTYEALMELFKKDEALSKEFEGLSKKKKKEMASRYIRKFNEKHPVYFPRN